MAEREASGDFDYRLGDAENVDALSSLDGAPEAAESEDLGYLLRDVDDEPWDDPFADDPDETDGDGHFDAFNGSTWSFQPAPTPWYRTKQAAAAIVAASGATAAIVVSTVLLVFRSPSDVVDQTPSVTPAAPTTSAAPTELATSVQPPPLPAPPEPPPSETAASSVNTGPAYNPPSPPRQTKAPEINVTRAPMSVAPQQRVPATQRR